MSSFWSTFSNTCNLLTNESFTSSCHWIEEPTTNCIMTSSLIHVQQALIAAVRTTDCCGIVIPNMAVIVLKWQFQLLAINLPLDKDCPHDTVQAYYTCPFLVDHVNTDCSMLNSDAAKTPRTNQWNKTHLTWKLAQKVVDSAFRSLVIEWQTLTLWSVKIVSDQVSVALAFDFLFATRICSYNAHKQD